MKNKKKNKDLFKSAGKTQETFNWNSYMRFVQKLKNSGFLADVKSKRNRRDFRKDIERRFEKARKIGF